jgi:hypothetical protein
MVTPGLNRLVGEFFRFLVRSIERGEPPVRVFQPIDYGYNRFGDDASINFVFGGERATKNDTQLLRNILNSVDKLSSLFDRMIGTLREATRS